MEFVTLLKLEIEVYKGLIARDEYYLSLLKGFDSPKRTKNTIQKLEKSIQQSIDRIKENQRRIYVIVSKIEQMDLYSQEIMRLRYVEGKKWADIAARVCYSERQVKRIHNRALQSLVLK